MIWLVAWALGVLGVGYFLQWSRIRWLRDMRRRLMRSWVKGAMSCFICLHGHAAWIVALVLLVLRWCGADPVDVILVGAPVCGTGLAQGLRLLSPLAAAAALRGQGPLAADLVDDDGGDDGEGT